MGRLVACKGENMKKKLLIILPACILGIVLIIFGVLYYKAVVPVREVEAEKLQKIHFKEEVNSAYACGYNSYGRIIFKHPKAALKQFKQDYAEGLAYMAKVYDLPEFSEQYEVLVQYEIYGWQTSVKEDIDNLEEVKKQLPQITQFAYQYWNGKWINYIPTLRKTI